MPERVGKVKRKLIAARAHGCCEYCMSPEECCPDPFSVEHIIPRARQGRNHTGNLAFCRQGCNNFKYVFVKGRDPLNGKVVALFHPRRQRWTRHFAWSDDFKEIIGLTPAGRATVVRLQLNRPGLRNLRAALVLAGLHPPQHSKT